MGEKRLPLNSKGVKDATAKQTDCSVAPLVA